MTPHKDLLDISVSPGLTTLRWTSINLRSYVDSIYAEIAKFEQFLDNVEGIRRDRVLENFKAMLKTPLLDIPQQDVISVSSFLQTTEELCQAAAMSLENKSLVIENAVKELISLLLPEDKSLPEESPENLTGPGALTISKKIELRGKLVQEAELLMEYFEQLNIDTFLQLIRGALEALKRRVSFASSLTYSDHSLDKHTPLFVADIMLSLPNLVMQPSLEEIQQVMNHVAQTVLAVTKNIYCWGQQRPSALPDTLQTDSLVHVRSKPKIVHHASFKLRTYFNFISEHKEIAKLLMSLGGTISSTKRIVKSTINQFNKYEHLWSSDREEHINKFAEDGPGVSDYEQEMHNLVQLESDIQLEPDSFPSGAVCLRTEQLKVMLVTEAKQWRVAYGRTMSHYYQNLLEKTFESIEEWGKSLSRPLNDLDDVRSVMATLKEVRENEISIDMSLGPIEVSTNFSRRYCITGCVYYTVHVQCTCTCTYTFHAHAKEIIIIMMMMHPKLIHVINFAGMLYAITKVRYSCQPG